MKFQFEIEVPRLLSNATLWVTKFFHENNLVLVYKGYGGDYELYTELCWQEDHELNLIDDPAYEDFRLWIRWRFSGERFSFNHARAFVYFSKAGKE